MFYSNKEVNDHNNTKLNRLKTKQYEIELVGEYPRNYKPKITSHGTVDDTNMYQTLKIKVGARVMLVLNINPNDSLVTGSLGEILDVVLNSEGGVRCIVIKFDSKKAGVEQRRHPLAKKYRQENRTPIFRQKVRYHLGQSGKNKHAATATVFQFPIKLAFAVTGHKMQC